MFVMLVLSYFSKMKLLRFFLFSLVFSGFSTFAQVEPNLKVDNLLYCQDSTIVITTNGAKKGLFDLKNQSYIIEPAKQEILFFDQQQLYGIFGKKENWFLLNKDEDEREELKLEDVNSLFVDFQIRFLENGSLEVQNFSIPNLYYSIYDVVTLDSGYTKSGIYNIKERRWDVPNKFARLNQINDYWFCLEEDSLRLHEGADSYDLGDNYIESKLSYTIYRNENGRFTEVARNIDSLNLDLIKMIWNGDKFQTQNNLDYIIWRNNLAGLLTLDLFFMPTDMYYPLVYYRHHLKPIFNQISINSERTAVLTLIEKKPYPISFLMLTDTGLVKVDSAKNSLLFLEDYGRSTIISDDSIKHLNDAVTVLISTKFGYHLMNDSLLIFNHLVLPEFYEVMDPDFGDPMVDNDGRVIYALSKDILNGGSVFNLNSGLWLLPFDYNSIFPTKSGWLVSKTFVKDTYGNGMGSFEDDYSLLKHDGKGLVENSRAWEVMKNKLVLEELIIDYPVDTLFEAPSGFEFLEEQERSSFYFRSGEKWGLFHSNISSPELFSIMAPKEFIHDNKSIGYTFYIENDELHLDLDGNDYNFLGANQTILLEYERFNLDDCENFKITKITGDDSLKFYPESDKSLCRDNYWQKFTITMEDGYVIINEPSLETHYVYDEYFENYASNVEVENSSVWKLENGVWNKKTAYFSQIQKYGNVIVAKTGSSDGNIVIVDGQIQYGQSGEILYESGKDDHYVIFNLNFRPIELYDFYDFNKVLDLGFGLAVNIEGLGNILIDYNSKPITSPNWDIFELENNRIKASKNAVYKIDEEYGDFELDENGDYIILEEERIEYFEFPK